MSFNTLYLIVGPSGSGKTTLMNNLVKFGFTKVRSTTTRSPREGETDYNFVSEDEFKALPDLLERDFYGGHFYGVTISALDAGDIFAITPAGMRVIKEHYTTRPIKVIGLRVGKSELCARLSGRGDTNLSRIDSDEEIFAKVYEECDCVIDAVEERQTTCLALHFAVSDSLLGG